MIDSTFDVAVIGGGVIGTAVAYHAAKRGLSVGLFDKGPLAGGSSGAALGFRTLSNFFPLEVALKNDERFIRFTEETGEDIELDTGGRINVAESEDDLRYMHDSVAALRAKGVDIRMLDRAEMREREPNLSPRMVGASWTPIGGNAMPIKLTYGLGRAARQLGARIFTHTAVTAIHVAGGRVRSIEAGGRKFSSGWVVNAAGAWAAAIAKLVDIDIPVVPRKGQLLLLDCPRRIVRHSLSSWHKPGPQPTGGTSIRSTPHGQILCGSSSEYVGFDITATEENARDVASRCAAFVPALRGLQITRTWAGLRPRAVDGNFIIGAADALDNFLIATGHDFTGISHSLITGELIAELIADGRTSVSIESFSPRRFARDFSSKVKTPARNLL
ncbi:MAG: FAD-binding oxidoreductase [Betaproteobacteria bacterium]|nr:MAG: FAD-binding oxidoreductase [Betaproteobacteria bacterium]